ncbi:alpha/beta hydrolase [Streptomyces sp. B6B3]|uniref:alpha/beta fold hydrolase n=1 Tax=Streptomyces sp. B6B3 TaxID=3153570 RepID=UPI00325CBE3D
MPTFSAHDGTTLSYRVSGAGAPLVCLAGGPMQDPGYLGDLGGLSAHRRLVVPDPRGTGRSAVPDDPASYRCDRLVDDVEALREHLGLDRLDLLAHCAGANLAASYVARHPERVGRLALITPSVFAVGIVIPGEVRRETAELRRGEPWFDEAFAALGELAAGRVTEDAVRAVAPLSYGRWDAAARAHLAAQDGRRNEEAAAVFGAEGAYDPPAIRAALGRFAGPVFVLAGAVDVAAPPPAVTEYAALFKDATLAVQPGGGHFPWLDDPDRFVDTVAPHLT